MPPVSPVPMNAEAIAQRAAQPSTDGITRFEVRPGIQDDPKGESVRREAHAALGISIARVRTARLYLVRGTLSGPERERIADGLLADPVLERAVEGAAPIQTGARTIEVHPLPGVMDPAAETVRRAIEELTGRTGFEVKTGWRYDVEGIDEASAHRLAVRLLANPVIEQVHDKPWLAESFPEASPADQMLRHIALTSLSDDELVKLSREGHLFLSLDEMRAIQAEYRRVGREPTDIELETLAQTWSEHCVHKTLKSRVRYSAASKGDLLADRIAWKNRPGHRIAPDGTVTIDNLLKSTVAAATNKLIADGLDWTLSVFVDNAGVIEFDEQHAVCIKVETHNHPSAIEPYGGAATGIGGCIRDIMGTGLAAKPIANTDVFCVAPPDLAQVPSGCLHPRRILERVVDGVRDYGNRMGIPTLNGAVWFDEKYVGNPLVFCGCIGVMPRGLIRGEARPGDLIIALGGRTGRDGIHGATFSSAELTDTHADEFSHAVQIGNAIEEKRTLDVILRARDHTSGCLYSAITDCGAGGFSSAVGEMGERVGAQVHLDCALLKYDGLRYDEIWISESQERMILAVPPEKLDALRTICDEEHVEISPLGTFGRINADGKPELQLHFQGREVGRLSMEFLHDGIPMPEREARWEPRTAPPSTPRSAPVEFQARIEETLIRLLAHPNIASKRWIVRQYDHEVQGNTVIKPLVGPARIGPGDAALLEPVPGTGKGLAIGCGLATRFGHPDVQGSDPYLMALAAIDECVRNLVCIGADPTRIAILDNFCWPSCNESRNMASLVRAAEGCYDAAMAYRTPFVSGKDSLNNQFRTDDGRLIEIPPTLLITGIGIVHDISRALTMDAKHRSEDGSAILLIGETGPELAGSHAELVLERTLGDTVSALDLESGPAAARAVADLISDGLVHAAHDCSEGGMLVAIAEMCIAAANGSLVGADVYAVSSFTHARALAPFAECFSETPGRYVLEVSAEDRTIRAIEKRMKKAGIACRVVGHFTRTGRVRLFADEPRDRPVCDTSVDVLRRAFLGTLDW